LPNYSFGIQIPYFHVETRDYLVWKKSQVDSKEKPPKLKPDELQRFGFLTELCTKYQRFRDKPDVYLHVPRTLDESYYTRLECARERDFDQVIYRYVNNRADEHGKIISQEGVQKHKPDVYLNVPRTLDESYYTRLECARERDFDQVIYRYVKNGVDEQGKIISQEGVQKHKPVGAAERHQDPKFNPRILMINQLWLWKIGGRQTYPTTNTHILRKTTDMIITAFPEPWSVGWNPILNQIQRAEAIASPDDMICQVVRECINFIDGRENGGLIENWLDIFEQSIAEQVSCS
jgi:hypothetical protein